MSDQPDKENGVKAASAHGKVPFGGKPGATDEDRRRGREEYARRLAEWSRLDLKQDFLDEAHMLECARRAGIRQLPAHAEPATPKRLARYGRRMGIQARDLPRLVGFRRYEELIAANPRWPLWALVCHLAEVKES